MRILLLCHSFNSLAQRLHVELRQAGHVVSVELDSHDDLTREAVDLFEPDLVVAPFLKRAIPEDVWKRVLCVIVHPGIRGDRGPHALDRAILDGKDHWGVTLIEAWGEMDAGPVWAWREFPMRPARKSDLYRDEVVEAASACVLEVVERIGRGERQPMMTANWGEGRLRPAMTKAERTLNPETMDASAALRVIRASDGDPGTVFMLAGCECRVFDARLAPGVSGQPGASLARSGHAVLVGFRKGALWIGHLRKTGAKALKLPAVLALGDDMPEVAEIEGPARFAYREQRGVGFLRFDFYNGAMSTGDCEAFRREVEKALSRPLKVLVLESSLECWSNGIHLAIIEKAESAADESWRNINAMNDLVETIIRATDRLVIAAVLGNAGAGGVFLSLSADEVWMRDGLVLNPHYKDMGNLYGSEYWTYLLPARTGEAHARVITQARLPMGVAEAQALGLCTKVLPRERAACLAELEEAAIALAASPEIDRRIADKQARLAQDEAIKPLADYRATELARMKRNFYGFDPSYHVARFNFIHKVAKSRTPATLAIHRDSARTRPSAERKAP